MFSLSAPICYPVHLFRGSFKAPWSKWKKKITNSYRTPEASKTKITRHECQTAVLLAVLFKLSAECLYVSCEPWRWSCKVLQLPVTIRRLRNKLMSMGLLVRLRQGGFTSNHSSSLWCSRHYCNYCFTEIAAWQSSKWWAFQITSSDNTINLVVYKITYFSQT